MMRRQTLDQTLQTVHHSEILSFLSVALHVCDNVGLCEQFCIVLGKGFMQPSVADCVWSVRVQSRLWGKKWSTPRENSCSLPLLGYA